MSSHFNPLRKINNLTLPTTIPTITQPNLKLPKHFNRKPFTLRNITNR